MRVTPAYSRLAFFFVIASMAPSLMWMRPETEDAKAIQRRFSDNDRAFADEKRAFVLALQHPSEDAGLEAIRDDGDAARVHRDPRRLKFRRHAAPPASGFPARDRFNIGGDLLDFGNEFGSRDSLWGYR